MIKIIYKITVLILLILLTSCSDKPSLQKYFIESENNNEILMVDIPTSILVAKDDISEEAKQALKSIDKLNLLAFRLKDDNVTSFTEEKLKIKEILKNNDYQELLRVNNKGFKLTVKFLGSEESINEVIVYAADNTKGFVLGRLLGNDIKPESMVNLLKSVKKTESNSDTFKALKKFFN
ncbi:MAG: DUF4252 domain-containing protein [Flavobacteriaceae bacterium]|nr:DUF4252 domain-containing protein [Flavobacteriaceae bacterium]